MGKALSSWERAERARERQSERAATVTIRRAERLVAASDRARERAHQRDERAQERARVAQEKERQRDAKIAAKQESIEAARREAEVSRAYIDGIGGLHRTQFSINGALSEFQKRASPRSPLGNTFEPVSYGGYFAPGIFSPVPFYAPTSFAASSHGRRSTFALVGAGVLSVGTGIAGTAMSDAVTGSYSGLGGLIIGLAGWAFVRSNAARAYGEEMATAARAHDAAEAHRRAAFDATESSRYAAYEYERQAFLLSEQERRNSFDREEADLIAQAQAADVERIDCLRAASNGDLNSQGRVLEAALPTSFSLVVPDGFLGAAIDDYEVAYRTVDGRSVELVVVAPDLDIIPDRAVELNAAGERTKFKVIPEKERMILYNRLIASLAPANALSVFAALPQLESVLVEAGAMVLDGSLGRDTERVALRVRYTAAKLSEVNVQSVDAIEVLRRFDHEHMPIGGRTALAAKIDRNTVVWASRIDDPVEVPYGLVPEQTDARLPPNSFATRGK